MGETPFYAEDVFVGVPLNIRLSRAGYRPWSASYPSSGSVRIEAVLERLPVTPPHEAQRAQAIGQDAQRKADDDTAKALGGKLDESGQFVDPDLEREMSPAARP